MTNSLKIILLFSIIIFSCKGPTKEQKEVLDTKNKLEEDLDKLLKNKFKDDISTYLNAYNKGDWDVVSNMWNPKLFEFAPRDQLVELLIQTEEMGMKMKFSDQSIEKISEIINYEDSKFSIIYYKVRLKVEISGDMLENIEQLKQNFIPIYGEDNLKYDETTNTFDIKVRNAMIAMSNEKMSDWKYLEYNKQQTELMEVLLPEEVLNRVTKIKTL